MQREAEIRRVEKEMAAFNATFPRPKNERIIKAVWKDYIWFNKKQNEAYCTSCKTEFKPLKAFKHKKECVCPVCGKKSEGRDFGRKKSTKAREDIHWLVVPRMNGDTFMTRRYRVCIWWKDFLNPIVDVTECYRDVHSDDGWKGYMWWQANSSLYAWMDYRDKRGMYYNSYTSSYYIPHTEQLYHPERLNKMFADTKYRYFPIAEMMEHYGDRFTWLIDSIVSLAATRPWLELLWKVGFKKLVDCEVTQYDRPNFNMEATNVVDLLGVTHAQYKMLLKHGNPTKDELKVLQETGVTDYEDWRELCQYSSYDVNRMMRLTRYAKLKKILRYLAGGVKLSDFEDYIGWGEKLGYNMTDEYYLFPAEFMAAHDKMLAEYKKFQNKQERKEKAKRNKIIKMLAEKNGEVEAFHLHSNGLFIRIAESEDELRNEGGTLHHCVATYAKRVANGETMILFIRKEAEPDTPYYTMEFKDGHIIQLRGARNCAPTEEVIKFREKFEKAIAKEAAA